MRSQNKDLFIFKDNPEGKNWRKKDAAFGAQLLAIQLDGVLNRQKDEDVQKCIHVKDRCQVGATYSALYLKRPDSFLFFKGQKLTKL